MDSPMDNNVAHALDADRITKRYGTTIALDDVSLRIGRGRFVTLLGPSGSGKTTLLMVIAGFTPPDSGRLLLDGRPIEHLPPEKRDFGMVFQGYALFPHLTVAENIAFPLRIRKVPRPELQKRVREALDLVQLTPFAARMPKQLSGGQQQRTALARALVFRPSLLLLDEPLSALDKNLRLSMQDELKTLHARLGLTFVYVTHDQQEALSLSDEVAILHRGRLVQVGTPETLYDRPHSRFVAGFLGRSNFWTGQIDRQDTTGFTYRVGDALFHQAGPAPAPNATPPNATPPGATPIRAPVTIALRPEKLFHIQPGDPFPNQVEGQVTTSLYLGDTWLVQLDTPSLGPVQALLPTWNTPQPRRGDTIRLGWDPSASIPVRPDDA
jgi:putative spermidine/putrescine transport system ATP-binding protein